MKPERPKISIEQFSSESAVDLSTKGESANIKESASLDFDDAEEKRFCIWIPRAKLRQLSNIADVV